MKVLNMLNKKENGRDRFWNFEIAESKNVVRLSKTTRFIGPFNKQHDKRAEALLKFA